MTEQHPITPPPELRRLWVQEAHRSWRGYDPVEWMQYVSEKAAQWGADQELEACCEWLDREGWPGFSRRLRAARRPTPPSLAEQGLEALRSTPCTEQRHYDALFAALNHLKQLEALPYD